MVNMIYSLLGYEKFRAGLQHYMKKHAYGVKQIYFLLFWLNAVGAADYERFFIFYFIGDLFVVEHRDF